MKSPAESDPSIIYNQCEEKTGNESIILDSHCSTETGIQRCTYTEPGVGIVITTNESCQSSRIGLEFPEISY